MTYKEECFKRFEYTQKYSKYNEEDLVDEIIDKDKQINNLQSKIDKAIDCIENLKTEFELYDYITDFDNKINKPIDILKEDK